MRTFPQCDSTGVKQSQHGRKSGGSALKKEANWIPFIQVRVNKLYIIVFSEQPDSFGFLRVMKSAVVQLNKVHLLKYVLKHKFKVFVCFVFMLLLTSA